MAASVLSRKCLLRAGNVDLTGWERSLFWPCVFNHSVAREPVLFLVFDAESVFQAH